MVYNVAHRYNDEECDACEDDQGTNVGTIKKEKELGIRILELGNSQ